MTHRRVVLLVAGLVLGACGNDPVTGISPSVTPPAPDPNAPKVYRTLDGKVFDTAEDRSAYLHAQNDAREREIYEAERFRQEQLSQSLSGVQALRRRSQLARVDRDIARAERDRRRAQRALARLERQERREGVANTAAARRNTAIAERRARQALRSAERELVAAERAERRLEQEDRVARPALRRSARPDEAPARTANPDQPVAGSGEAGTPAE
ncbi:MAG: hypothetical protein AAFV19_07275 [Pseudomonadota bacterium]